MLKIVALLILALTLVGSGMFVSQHRSRMFTTTSAEAYELYWEGDEHLTAFQWDEGVAKLENALALDPQFAMAAAALANGYDRQGYPVRRDSLAAIADGLARDLSDDKERMLVQLRLSHFKCCSDLVAQRDSLLSTLQEIAPRNLAVLIATASDAKARGDEAAAAEGWRRVVEKDPNYAAAYNELGYIAFNRGDYDEAIELLQRYAYLAPGVANPHDSLGEVLMYTGRYEEAVQEFRQAIELQPDYVTSLINLARIYVAQGRMSKGIALFDQISEGVANSYFAKEVGRIAIGTYYENGLDEALARAVERYINTFPEDDDTVVYRAFALAYRGEPVTAVAIMDSALAVWRENPYFETNHKMKRNIEATEAHFRAMLCEHEGKAGEAAENWIKSIDLLSGFAPGHRLHFVRGQYGTCLLAEGKNRDALAQATVVLEVNPRDARALINATEACLALERRSEARKYLDQLERSLALAEPEFPAVQIAAELRQRLERSEQNS